MDKRQLPKSLVAVPLLLAAFASLSFARSWDETAFAHRPLIAYPLPGNHDSVVGSLTMYKVQPGDTLLDVLNHGTACPAEVSDANNHLDWSSPIPRKGDSTAD